MSLLMSPVLFLFPRDVFDENCNLIGSVSEGFPTYFSYLLFIISHALAVPRDTTSVYAVCSVLSMDVIIVFPRQTHVLYVIK